MLVVEYPAASVILRSRPRAGSSVVVVVKPAVWPVTFGWVTLMEVGVAPVVGV